MRRSGAPGRRRAAHLVVDLVAVQPVADLIGAAGEYRALAGSEKTLQLPRVLGRGDGGLEPEQHVDFGRDVRVVVEVELDHWALFVEKGREQLEIGWRRHAEGGLQGRGTGP